MKLTAHRIRSYVTKSTLIGLCIGIIGLIVVIMGDMATSDWFFLSIGSLVMIGIGFGVILCAIGLVVCAISKGQRTGLLRWGCGIVIFCMLELWLSGRLFHYQEARSFQEARTIIQALDHYYQYYHEYPSSLQDLIPDYLTSLPSTKIRWGTESFWYERPQSEEFALMFLGHVMSICSYTSERPTWECHGT